MRFGAPVCFAAACLLAGCIGGVTTGGARITYQDDFFPAEWEETAVVLRLANIDIDADIEATVEGHEHIIRIVKAGSLVEEERYRVTTEGIWLVTLGSGEIFEEPLPLIKYPMDVGERLSWTGTVGFGARRIPATGDISSRRDQLSLATGQVEALHVQVDLTLNDGSPQPAKRRLDFWLAKGKGLLKRDYGNQIREPRLPDPEPQADRVLEDE